MQALLLPRLRAQEVLYGSDEETAAARKTTDREQPPLYGIAKAYIGGAVEAPSISVQAVLGGDGVTTLNAEAISGGGDDSDIGVAGAVAVNVGAELLPVLPIDIPQPDLEDLLGELGAEDVLPDGFSEQFNLPAFPSIPEPTGGTHLAVIQEGAEKYLVLSVDGKSQKQSIEVLSYHQGKVAVAGNINQETLVVVAGHHKLPFDGMPVMTRQQMMQGMQGAQAQAK